MSGPWWAAVPGANRDQDFGTDAAADKAAGNLQAAVKDEERVSKMHLTALETVARCSVKSA